MRINLKGHARRRFDERYPDMAYDTMIHHFKTGKLVKKPKKPGVVGGIVKKTAKGNLRFKFIVRDG
jgi:hypothetical protein